MTRQPGCVRRLELLTLGPRWRANRIKRSGGTNRQVMTKLGVSQAAGPEQLLPEQTMAGQQLFVAASMTFRKLNGRTNSILYGKSLPCIIFK